MPKTIVILGASPNPARYSNMLLRRLKGGAGYAPVPVRPGVDVVEGLPAHASLATVEPGPDVLTLYVNAAVSAPLGPDILRLRPRKVIFNPGAENRALESRLNAAGIETENACSLVLLGQGLL